MKASDDVVCPVCYELTPDVLSECGHTLCFACATRCFRSAYLATPRCPLCRAVVTWDVRHEKEEGQQQSRRDVDDDGAGIFFRRRPLPRPAPLVPSLVRLHRRLSLRGFGYSRRTRDISLVPTHHWWGLSVVRLPEDTPASPRYLQVGDLVTHVNWRRVETADDALRLMRGSGVAPVWVSVWRRRDGG